MHRQCAYNSHLGGLLRVGLDCETSFEDDDSAIEIRLFDLVFEAEERVWRSLERVIIDILRESYIRAKREQGREDRSLWWMDDLRCLDVVSVTDQAPPRSHGLAPMV